MWLCLPARGGAQIPDSVADRMKEYAYAVEAFGKALPQEKVYVHFDNTGYYQGDDIWFQCYVVTAGSNQPTTLSKTLYVELLNPGGEIIAKQTLPITRGRCRGNFELKQLPFYSGFYEVRAYTKYMLNFGEATIFSRIFPVFDKPTEAGDYTQKAMCRRTQHYPQRRERSKKGKKLNLRFYPEGGYLLQQVPVRVAFEATDAFGNPVELTGHVVDDGHTEPLAFHTNHEGKGVFTYTAGETKAKAEVVWNEKRYRFDLPEAQARGFAFSVDNLSSEDSLLISVQKSPLTQPEVLGVVVLNQGKAYDFCMLSVFKNQPVRFPLDKRNLPAGVSQVVLYNRRGQLVADRLIFSGRPDTLSLSVRADKELYEAYDSIRLDFCVKDAAGRPVQTPFSVSVRDGREEVKERHSMLTDLLLMSEIKGYVRRPSWYFESDDEVHRRALDELLLVQGWRRYDWECMSGRRPFDLKYYPEQGIELHGQVVSMARSKPRPGVQVTSFLAQRGADAEGEKQPFFDVFTTDSMGRFSFLSQIKGKWNLILSVSEKGKKKDHRIVLDRVFNPAPQPYPLAEMQVETAEEAVAGGLQLADALAADTALLQEDLKRFVQAYEDSLRRLGETGKIQHLDEVVVKAKRRDKASEVYQARTKSIAYYDVASEMDDIQDRNVFIGDDIHELMIRMHPEFYRTHSPSGQEYLLYKGKLVLFSINYERTNHTEMDYNKYRLLTLESIKSVYISEDLGVISQYADPRFSPMNIDDLYRCVVLIETYPEAEIPAKGGKGVRKTWLEGYSEVKEFYQPDYRVLPQDADYRRTLYWNPEVLPDKEGKATLHLYNNSRAQFPKITVETVSDNGEIGVLHQR